MPKRTRKDEVVKFEVKRHHLFGALGLILGVLLGYSIWGLGPNSNPEVVAQENGQASDVNDLASQLEDLPRYEVTISEDDPILGREDALITIIEFADFQCPFCQRHAQETHPRLIEEYGDQIRFVYKDFPLSSIHPEAYPSALAAQCAQAQEKFWEYHDLLYSTRLELSRETYLSYADELGLDLPAFTACIDDQTYAETVQEDYNVGQEIGISSTPTFFVNGVALVGAQPFEVFAEIIDYELGVGLENN